MLASPHQYILNFKVPSGTSRGVLTTKESWFIVIEHEGKKGIGECGLLRGLSADDRPDYAAKVKWACDNLYLGEEALWEALREFPSIQFGLETAFRSWSADDPFVLFPSAFTEGSATIPINGLVWMGSEAYMKEQIDAKIEAGFHCIKLKIGAIGFQKEWALLRSIREHFSPDEIEIRVDANGAFRPNDALEKLHRLSDLGIHSIEQPIATKQLVEMEALCRASPIPIALDEELIGIFTTDEKKRLLDAVAPQYIILKPSFIGGFRGTAEWIELAEERGIGWWVTSALESNVGLNAIAQWTFLQPITMPQGLGTGALYHNNFESPLEVRNGQLQYDCHKPWEPVFDKL